MYTSIFFFCFSGVTLGAAGESHTWDPNSKEEYPCNYKLIIKQILLGREAKDSEYNVVQVRLFFRKIVTLNVCQMGFNSIKQEIYLTAHKSLERFFVFVLY